MTSEQQRYQVRFDWGSAGARAIAQDADVLVWVDAHSTNDPPVADLPVRPAVVATDLAGAAATADWIMSAQLDAGKRVMIAVVAAGGLRGEHLRPVIEDQLAAGAVISFLCDHGLDATSPEAAVAEAAYRGLRKATSHLFSASVTAQLSQADPRHDRVNLDLTRADVRVIRPRA